MVKRIIESYNDYLAALKAKSSEDPVTRNEGKNALGNLRIRDPKRFEEYKARYEDKQLSKNVSLSTPKRINKTTWTTDNELRELAKERIRKSKYKFIPFYLDLPFGVKSDDVLAAVEELPIKELLTKGGELTRRDVILKRCIKRLLEQGKIDGTALRKESINLFNRYYSTGAITVNKPLKRADVVCYLSNDISIEELLEFYPSNSAVPLPWKVADYLNSKKMTILPNTHPLVIQFQKEETKAREREQKKAQKEALRKRNEATKAKAGRKKT